MYMVYSKGCFDFSKQVPFIKRLNNKELHSESVRNTWIWHLARDSLFWFGTKQRLFLFEPCQAQRGWVITMLRAKLQKNCKRGEICLWHLSRSLCVTYTLIFPLKISGHQKKIFLDIKIPAFPNQEKWPRFRMQCLYMLLKRKTSRRKQC